MEATREKTYSSPQRKLVKFFERSRNQWKAKAGAAKTVLKRLGTRVRRLERSKREAYHQLAVLQTQVAEWQAKHAQTVRELEELKKKSPPLSGDSERGVSSVERSSGIITIACRKCWWWSR